MSVSKPQTWRPEEGVDPRFDCPDCSYARTGMSTSRHAFKRHLYTEHEYSVEDVRRLLSGTA